ncbi:type II toxin-antitoxin system RelE/ParE family toxin [Neorhizobium alkalisoli]|uniref:Toxin ParE1/3/4 n=1 Tax=Neorhizobium alkalisoli TaxID=528178 RepID=A0A561QWL4_9HYPH|nr:type II toxin-antitoxin system RelE/ParE family toxin [Neorhizobium alkalisoli]TWF54748.1 toxin ParE1/3/4 [Neorhizobium alkalisoli]
MILFISDTAEQDFERIGDYIAGFNPARAESFVEELFEHCQRFVELPLQYQLVVGHEESGMRRAPHGSYLIFYRVEETRVEIVRILNAAQDHEAILFPEDVAGDAQ